MFLLLGGGPLVTLVLVICVLRHVARQYGWLAVLMTAMAIPCLMFAGLALMAEVLGFFVIGVALALLCITASIIFGHDYPPNAARRLYQRQIVQNQVAYLNQYTQTAQRKQRIEPRLYP
jgi:hypothetical protein